MNQLAVKDIERELATITPVKPLTQIARLKRWAELLEQDPGRRLFTLFETEHQSAMARELMRADDSPISIAYADPVLRADGLRGDTFGDAQRYFGLTDHQLHRVLCYCKYGETVSASTSAQSIRNVIKAHTGPTFRERVRGIFGL